MDAVDVTTPTTSCTKLASACSSCMQFSSCMQWGRNGLTPRPSQVKSRDQLSSSRVAAQKVEGASGIARGRGGECPRRGSPPAL